MASEPTLLFLHGVGTGDQEDSWKASLSTALQALGYPSLDDVHVIAPKYAVALHASTEKTTLPPVSIGAPSRDAARQNRRDFERRTAAMEFRLGRHDGGVGQFGADALVSAVVELPIPLVTQARNYLRDPQIRAQILNLILDALPDSGRVVIIGHSLGSVIAADLIRRLPVGLEVTGLLTIGSPLANGAFNVDKVRDLMKEPPANLNWWVNVWNRHDPIAAHRGVSSVFPWMVDFRIHSNPSLAVHDSVAYLAEEVSAAAVGFALFGSTSQEVATTNRGIEMPLDEAEHIAILALRYAHLIKRNLTGDTQDRFAGALRQVQAATFEEIRRRNIAEGRGMPSAIARLAFDLSDSQATIPEPLPGNYFEKDEAVTLLTLLATENVIRPFEISIKNEQLDALRELSAEMGLGSKFGTDVSVAVKDSQEALGGGRDVNWVKWGAMAAGATAIVIATGGLALAAAPGLAGAAVITTALAGFGPGGMIGGLLTAGTLVTAGGGGIALGLSSSGTTAETLEAVVVRRLAAAILRLRHNLEPDPELWRILAETEITVRREHERLDEFSDQSSPVLKALEKKIETLERALKFLRENGLEPGVRGDDAEATSSPVAALISAIQPRPQG